MRDFTKAIDANIIKYLDPTQKNSIKTLFYAFTVIWDELLNTFCNCMFKVNNKDCKAVSIYDVLMSLLLTLNRFVIIGLSI